MIPVLLILIPLVSGFIAFSLKRRAHGQGLGAAIVAGHSCRLLCGDCRCIATVSCSKQAWSGCLTSEAGFAVRLDGLSTILSLLMAVSFPIIFIATWKDEYRRAWNFLWADAVVAGGADGRFRGDGCAAVLFFLGTGADSSLFPLLPVGRRPTDRGDL